MNEEKKVALIVLRAKPAHIGHTNLAFKAMLECDEVILMFGSSNAPITEKNPFKVSSTMKMFKKIFGNEYKKDKNSKIKYMSVPDIGAVTKEDWCEHVFGIIETSGATQPTHYYAGDIGNASWFKGITNIHTGKQLEVVMVNRLASGIMSGTEIRQCISLGEDEWKDFVPPVIHENIQKDFPLRFEQEFREQFIKTNRLTEIIDDIISKDGNTNLVYKELSKFEPFIEILKKNTGFKNQMNSQDVIDSMDKLEQSYEDAFVSIDSVNDFLSELSVFLNSFVEVETLN